MKKVYQRIIDPKKGDCFKCCIASLLELDYDEVPNFVEQEDWFGAAIDFCKEHGYDFAYREYFNPNLNYLEDPTHGCFKPWNLDGTYHLDKLGREEGVDGLFLAGVYSPKYTNAREHPIHHLHSVIIDKDCNIVFDPQKEYEGLLEYPYSRLIGFNGIRDVMVITKLKEEMMGTVSESIKTEWREFSYVASELHRRKIETVINQERGDIQLRDEKTGKTLTFGSLLEVKAFALGLDWGVKNAEDMDFCGLLSPICKEEWK